MQSMNEKSVISPRKPLMSTILMQAYRYRSLNSQAILGEQLPPDSK